MDSAPEKQSAPSWQKTFLNRLPALMQAIDELCAYLEKEHADAKALYAARFAAEEMGTNIIKYGFDDQAEHLVTFQVFCPDEVFELRIIDDGHAFDPTARPHPDSEATLDERTPGGWGISLVRKLVTEMTYERSGNHNILTLRMPKRNPDA
jgi:serine/threonine-protein kinase RsbW